MNDIEYTAKITAINIIICIIKEYGIPISMLKDELEDNGLMRCGN